MEKKLMIEFSIEQYKKYCKSLFAEYDSDETIAKKIENLDINEFYNWYLEVHLKTDIAYKLISNWISLIRKSENYNFEDESKDPLKREENQKVFNTYKKICLDVSEEFDNRNIIKEKLAEYHKYRAEKEYQDSLMIHVDGVLYKATEKCEVLWSGWECDNYVWLVNVDGKNKLVTSNHGAKMFVEKDFLEGKVKEYNEAIKNSEKLLKEMCE